jgi:hypothetical protein
MSTLYSISLKRQKGERLYLKSYSTNRPDAWTTHHAERYWTESWTEIEDLYNDLVHKIELYETRQTVKRFTLAEYLNGQSGALELMETRDRPLTRRSLKVKQL